MTPGALALKVRARGLRVRRDVRARGLPVAVQSRVVERREIFAVMMPNRARVMLEEQIDDRLVALSSCLHQRSLLLYVCDLRGGTSVEQLSDYLDMSFGGG